MISLEPHWRARKESAANDGGGWSFVYIHFVETKPHFSCRLVRANPPWHKAGCLAPGMVVRVVLWRKKDCSKSFTIHKSLQNKLSHWSEVSRKSSTQNGNIIRHHPDRHAKSRLPISQQHLFAGICRRMRGCAKSTTQPDAQLENRRRARVILRD